MSLPTLPDLKAHLNMGSFGGDDDAELSDTLEAAVDVVEGIIGPITAQSVTETHHNVLSDALVLRETPVAELLSVTARSSRGATPSDVSGYDLNRRAGLLRRMDGSGFSGSYTVTYSAGRPTVPAAVRLAILIIAAHLWETQRMPGQSAISAPAGFGGVDGIPDVGDTARGFAIPRRAEELLKRYMRPGGIA